MRIQDLANELRAARLGRGLTQAELAREVGISRETLNLLENGRLPDLGIRKVLNLMDKLGLDVAIQSAVPPRRRDYVRMATTTANVSFKSAITDEELIRALTTGKVPTNREPHLRALFDEAPPSLLRGLFAEAVRWTKPGKLDTNLRRLIQQVGATRRIDEWLKSD